MSYRGWQQEAALQIHMCIIELEAAAKPNELVAYGGTGRAKSSEAVLCGIAQI